MLSMIPMPGAHYFRHLEPEGGQGQTPAAVKGYYQAGVDAGEPPGHVVRPGALSIDETALNRARTFVAAGGERAAEESLV